MKKRNMNDYICKLLVRVRYLAMSFVIALLLSVDTVSAASDAKRVVSTTTSQIKSLLSTAYDLVFVLIGGVSMVNLIIAIGKFMKEDDYPYVPLERACLFDASKAVANVASYVGVSWMSEADLKTKVANYGVAAIAIFASLSSFMSYESGIYYDILCEPLTQNHGVGCVGYGTENGTDFWIVRNSWGKGWGEDGYIRIKRNAWNQCGVASNAIIPLVE